MKTISATIAIALALAAVPSASIAQPAPAVTLGVAFLAQNNRVKVAEVRPGGTGDLMGVQAGDIIILAGDQRVNSIAKLTAYLRKLSPGDTVALTVRRGGENLELTGTALER